GSLRVVRVGRDGRLLAVSQQFPRAALLTSSLAAAWHVLLLGAARLDLAGPPSAPPYRLRLYVLDPKNLAVLASTSLGRGEELELSATGTAPARTIASTGGALVAIDRHQLGPRVTTLVRFAPFVAQHVAADRSLGLAVVSLLRAGATGRGDAGRIEVIDPADGRVLSKRSLGSGLSVQSLVAAGDRVAVAGGAGPATTVSIYELPSLDEAVAQSDVPAVLESERLAATTGNIVIASALTQVACLDVRNGEVVASTSTDGSSALSLGALVPLAGQKAAYDAVTSAGLGELRAPPACS
ncbi:MAG: hypothetical protein ACRD0B_13080, partial [Acidimicrobiales bacterium]